MASGQAQERLRRELRAIERQANAASRPGAAPTSEPAAVDVDQDPDG